MADLTPTQLAQEFARLVAEYEDRGLAVVQGRCNLAEYDARFHRLRDALWDNRDAIAAALTERAQQDDARSNAIRAFGETAKLLAERTGVILKDDYPCNQVAQIVNELLAQIKVVRRVALEQAEQACQEYANRLSQSGLHRDCRVAEECAVIVARLREP